MFPIKQKLAIFSNWILIMRKHDQFKCYSAMLMLLNSVKNIKTWTTKRRLYTVDGLIEYYYKDDQQKIDKQGSFLFLH
jgi:hypothetical protein